MEEDDKKEKIHIQSLIANLDKFLKGIERLFIALNKAKKNNMRLDFIHQYVNLKEYQHEWKKVVDFHSIKVKNHNRNNNMNFVEKKAVQKRIAQDIEIMTHLSENIIMKRNAHNFTMGQIFKTTLGVQEYFGKNNKKVFKQFKKNLVSLSGVP